MPSCDPLDFLAPPDRLALKRTCDRLGISWRGWRRVSWLRVQYEALAVEGEADRMQRERPGLGRMRALELACWRVGVSFGSHRSRVQRAVRDALDPAREPDESNVA